MADFGSTQLNPRQFEGVRLAAQGVDQIQPPNSRGAEPRRRTRAEEPFRQP